MSADLETFRACTGESVRIDCTTEDCNEKLLQEFLRALQCLSSRSQRVSWNDPKCPVKVQQEEDVEEKLRALEAARLMFHDITRLSAPLLFAASINKGEDARLAHQRLRQALGIDSVSTTLLFKGIMPFVNLPSGIDPNACLSGGQSSESEEQWMKVAVLQLLLELAMDKSNPLIVSRNNKALVVKSADPSSVSMRLVNLLSASGLNLSVEQRKRQCEECLVQRASSTAPTAACLACYSANLDALSLDKDSPEVQQGERLRELILSVRPEAPVGSANEVLAQRAMTAVESGNARYLLEPDAAVEQAVDQVWAEL